MRNPEEIRQEIEQLTEKRREVFHALSEGHDLELAAEHQRLEEEIARLWEERRMSLARLRFGERDQIIQRARAEERLERAA